MVAHKSQSSTNNAFTLLEVIFAIVVMGIIVVSLPRIMSSNQKGIDTTIIQEAIFGASTELNQALSYRWDENSRDDILNPNGLAYVIETGDCDNNASSPTYRLRPGHINQPLHRRCLDSNATAPTAQASFDIEVSDGGVLDDVDDINTSSKPIFLNAGSSTGYKQDYTSVFSINYANIGDINASDEDAKLITITVSDPNGVIVTRLRSFTVNIGEVDFYKRTY